ncbi:molecular chaperone DnaJ [Asticcacaulis sp. 201]|uniref:J domain-containing protein n=1 Tax=Asticcacaulis sp. 201 TaxID=3028787 RepID=UPI00291622E5|nr:molecular chaperone DnaJ [Asticcacaulis sp. 201]MDV6332767.1 molecular chaperone DnaJ [Asticcacaulis sp. 201]
MIWVLGALAVFFLLVYVGRNARPGPWIRQFRAVRSLISMALLMLAVTLFLRGQIGLGFGALLGAFVMGGSVRYQTYFRREAGPPPSAAVYSSEEIKAYQTLGLSIGADRKAVKEAWKRLMKTAHPDQGGDVNRASAVNAARDVLLKRRR